MAGRGVDQIRLLRDLRGQVTALEKDLRERSKSVEKYRSALNLEYTAAREAQRTAASYTTWRDERITQVAVAWVLATVFVRFCEDNGLVESAWIAGSGERVREAEDRHSAYFKQHPEQNDCDWLIASIQHLASTNETVAGLFDEAHNPLWEIAPSYEAAGALLTFWRRPGPDGEIVHDFADPDWNTRFLGDLYQNLSESARKTYALLQTPEFVEEFILDLTLEPAIKEFGLAPEWRYRPSKWVGHEGEMPTGLRTIDPACGSGHFLLGIFHRLLAKWEEAEPGTGRWELIRRTLESVHGCDKNPFAVAIARFRLLVAALRVAGENRLDRAPLFPIHIAVGDSLIHGRDAETVTDELFTTDAPFTYATEDVYEYAARCDLLGRGSYHVVVANPPYITVKDKLENENYRKSYYACSGAYSLSAPFAQRIFELSIPTQGQNRAAGFTGQITANSFMKREFGKKLINPFFTSIDLTHVIDTSGAYIPGHGIPTVILAGRNRIGYQSAPIRAILGIQGEPSQPTDASKGLVWSAIVDQVNRPGTESDWVTAEDLRRERLASHPWSLSGGGAGDLVDVLQFASKQKLASQISSIGFMAVTREDEAYFIGSGTADRLRIPEVDTVPGSGGTAIRDWMLTPDTLAIFPYQCDGRSAEASAATLRHLWKYRRHLANRRALSGTQEERGLAWYEYSDFHADRWSPELLIVFAFVSTHNHFTMARNGNLFIRSAPVIKLKQGAPENDHLALTGLLNSSISCFWLKQVSQAKSGADNSSGGGNRWAPEMWMKDYEFTGTKLENFPIPEELPLRLGEILDRLAIDLSVRSPSNSCTKVPTSARLAADHVEDERIRSLMIAAQEELDWQVYGSYQLLSAEDVGRATVPGIENLPEVRLGERAFEIVLARKVAAGRARSAWFERHGSTPVTEIPKRWPEEYRQTVQARIEMIETRPRDIGLLERPDFKRRWASKPWKKREQLALRTWLLDRCEKHELWFGMRDGLGHPRTLTVSQLADEFRADDDMQNVAALYASAHLGKRDLPLAKILIEVVKEEHVPYLSALRYKDSGLQKRADWEKAWEQQREEDRTGKRLEIPIPPKYTTADFKTPSYWSHRGKLDVPRERFISYPGANPDADDTLLLGWAGWDHKDQAQALVNLINDRTEQAAWGTEQLTPPLAGLLEIMPWVHQWHGEYDPEWEGVPAEEFQAFLDVQRSKHRLSEENLKAWRPAARGGRKS